MTGKDATNQSTTANAHAGEGPAAAPSRSFARAAIAGLAGHRRVAGGLGAIAIAAIVALAYVVGGPPSTEAHGGPAATAGPARLSEAAPVPAEVDTGGKEVAYTQTGQGGSSQNTAQAAADAAQIIKTGELSLEVNDIDAAVERATAAVAGLGGTVDSSSQYGTGDEAGASITFRIPVAKWDEAISTLRGIGTKVVSLKTSSTNVTLQVLDLDARIANLEKTQEALQSIMARATAIADVIAVETQLSQIEGQIEQLKTQRNYLQNQVAMSTLTVTFALPGKTVTTQATQDWTLGNQIDQAGAALVRIGQGLVTLCVWLVVVVLPLALAVLVLLGIVWILRRIFGRGRRRDAAAGA